MVIILEEKFSGMVQRFDLKRFRKDHKLTQKQVCEVMNYTQGFVSSMENGHDAIPDAFITRLCKVYDVKDPNKYMYVEKVENENDPGSTHDAIVLYLIKQNELLQSMLIEKDKTIEELRRKCDDLYEKLIVK